MKPRIEKKVSKKLAAILGNSLGEIWIDDELELWTKHYAHNNDGALSPKQKRENYQQRVRVNHMPSIGGGLDYWGEGQDWHSVYRAARESLMWEGTEIDENDGWPIIKERMTARWVLGCARDYAAIRSGQVKP